MKSEKRKEKFSARSIEEKSTMGTRIRIRNEEDCRRRLEFCGLSGMLSKNSKTTRRHIRDKLNKLAV